MFDILPSKPAGHFKACYVDISYIDIKFPPPDVFRLHPHAMHLLLVNIKQLDHSRFRQWFLNIRIRKIVLLWLGNVLPMLGLMRNLPVSQSESKMVGSSTVGGAKTNGDGGTRTDVTGRSHWSLFGVAFHLYS